MDFALTDSVLHFNDGKRGHAGIFSRMILDGGIPSHIYYWANDTRRICASAKRKRFRVEPSPVGSRTVLPIVINKFKPKYDEQKLLGLQ